MAENSRGRMVGDDSKGNGSACSCPGEANGVAIGFGAMQNGVARTGKRERQLRWEMG